MNNRGGEPPASSTSAGKKIVRTFTATARELEMLEAVARYHGFSKSATITSLIKKEFWRIFPAGTGAVKPDRGARVDRASRPAGRRASQEMP